MPQAPPPAAGDNAPTTAFSAQRPPNAGAADKPDQDSTEQLNTRDADEPKRRGGGMSAQDLLRREGRL